MTINFQKVSMYLVAAAIFVVGGAAALNWINPAVATALLSALGGLTVAGLHAGTQANAAAINNLNNPKPPVPPLG
jgi:hypothetical protein